MIKQQILFTGLIKKNKATIQKEDPMMRDESVLSPVFCRQSGPQQDERSACSLSAPAAPQPSQITSEHKPQPA